MEIEHIVMTFVAIIVGIVLVGGVALPAVYQPITHSYSEEINTTTLNPDNVKAQKITNTYVFATPNADTTTNGYITITHNATIENVRLQIGTTYIGNLTDTATSSKITVPMAKFGTTTAVYFNSSSNTTTVTGATLSWYTQAVSTQQGWNSAVVILIGVVLAIVLIAALLLIVMKEF